MAPDARNPADMHVNCHDRNWVWKATLLVPASSDKDEIKRRCVLHVRNKTRSVITPCGIVLLHIIVMCL
jgi:hypothetical protein